MSEWQTKTLGEITDWFSGGTPSKQNESYWNGDIPWISAKTLKGTRVSDSELKITKEGLENGSRLALEGDLLLLVRGSGLFNSIPISIVEKPVSFNQDIKAIRIKKEYDYISPWFLLYWLHGNTRILYGIMEETGIGAGKFDLNLLKDLIIELPTKKELQEITQTFKSIDDKIVLLNQQNHDLEELTQTLFKRWFVEFEFPTENGEPYKSSGGIMIESELGEIPEGWRLGRLGDIYKTTSGGTPSRQIDEFYNLDGIPWIKSKELESIYVIETEECISEEGLKKSSAKLLPKDTILVAMYGATVGQLSLTSKDNMTCNQAICAILEGEYSFPFCYLLLKYFKKDWTGLAIGSAQQNLSQVTITGYEIIIPSIHIERSFTKVIKPIYNSIKNNFKEIQTLIQLRDTLLPKLMSGEIRVR